MKAFNQKSVGIHTTYNFELSFFLLYKFFTQTMSQCNWVPKKDFGKTWERKKEDKDCDGILGVETTTPVRRLTSFLLCVLK